MVNDGNNTEKKNNVNNTLSNKKRDVDYNK